MLHEDHHLSDEELLLAADGELPARAAGRVQSHLAACWSCRARQQELERAIGAFVREYGQSHDAQIPNAEGPRALLKAQLAQLGGNPRPSGANWFGAVSVAVAACALAVFGLFIFHNGTTPQAAHSMAFAAPNPSLTPGATVLISRGEVCRESAVNNKVVPVALQRKVFEEYGIAGADPRAYEVDYLVTPALGGADDIHNLWPHSYSATIWSAQVKDELEDRLRKMVCDGQLDLATAQRDIAVNWIEAYKKYFKTDQPLERVP
jgi:hypothetical protein